VTPLTTIALFGALVVMLQSPPREPSDLWYRRHLPATIEVTKDVEAIADPVTVHRRGTLYIGRSEKSFQIKKGQTFQMTKLLGEGACRIRFQNRVYNLRSCPWLEGFSDRETDIYALVGNK
jgi:hypothetical protein